MNEQQEQECAELRARMKLDIHALHRAAEAQPDLCRRAGELHAELNASAKRAKVRLGEVRADADHLIREAPEEYNLAKITEGAVTHAIALMPSVQAAEAELITAELERDRASATSAAYDHRRSMIKVEADLYKSNYWGGPDAQIQEMERPRTVGSENTEERLAAHRAGKPSRRRRTEPEDDGE